MSLCSVRIPGMAAGYTLINLFKVVYKLNKLVKCPPHSPACPMLQAGRKDGWVSSNGGSVSFSLPSSPCLRVQCCRWRETFHGLQSGHQGARPSRTGHAGKCQFISAADKQAGVASTTVAGAQQQTTKHNTLMFIYNQPLLTRQLCEKERGKLELKSLSDAALERCL